MRILCLHGFSQSAVTFRKRIAVLKSKIKSELVFIDGPIDLENGKCWWKSSDDREIYHGLDESINIVKSVWNSNEFDGILGFSQGATFTAILSTILYPKFIIVVSGFLPFPESLKNMSNISIPSLHIMGKTDEWVPVDENFKLSQAFINPVVYIHDGG